MKLWKVLAAIIALAPFTAEAWPVRSSGQYERTLKIGAGGWLTGLDITPDGQRLARSDTYNAYIWNAGTATWRELLTQTSMPAANFGYFPTTGTSQVSQSATGVYEVAAAPSNSAIIYIAFNNRVFKSTNRGATFSLTGFATQAMFANGSYRMNGRKLAVDPANPDHVYLGTDTAGMFETVDGGTTWLAVSAVPTAVCAGGSTLCPSYNIVFDQTSGTIGGKTTRAYAFGYTGAANSVYVTVDAGATWVTAAGGGPSSSVQRMVVGSNGVLWVVDGLASGGVWKYTGGTGGTWANVLSSGNTIHSVAVDPANANRIVAGTTGGNLFTSTDATTFGTTQSFTRTAADIPWLAWAREQFMSNGDMVFDPSQSNVLVFGEGIGVWTASPPNSGSFVWASASRGIEQLVSRHIVAANGVPIVGVSDRSTWRLNSPNTYPSTYNAPYQNAVSLAVTWQSDYAKTDKNYIASVTGTNGTANYSGFSLDGGSTWKQFSSYHETVTVGAGTVANNGSGAVRLTVASTSGLTTWANGAGTIVRVLGFNGATTSLNQHWPATIVDATHIDLQGSSYSSSFLTCVTQYPTCNLQVYVDTTPLTSNDLLYTVLGAANNGSGAIRISIANSGSALINGILVCISGVTGTAEANGCWVSTGVTNTINAQGGKGTLDLYGSTFTNAYVSGGVAKKFPPGGGSIAVSTPQNMVLVGGSQDYPQCTLDGGSTWTELQVPAPTTRTITNAVWSGGQITFTLSSAVTVSSGSFGTYFTVSGMTPSGYNGTYSSLTSSSSTTTVAVTKAADPGAATVFGTWAPYGYETGWVNADYVNRQIITASSTPGTFYLYNYLAGTYKVAGCTVQGIQSALVSQATVNSKLFAIPGHAGRLVLAVGSIGAEPGALHPANVPLAYSTNEGTSWTNITNTKEPRALGLGAVAPGSDHPTVYMVGWVSDDFGVWRSTSTAAQWAANSVSWTKVASYMLGSMDNITTISGDDLDFAKFYVGWSGSGFAHGRQNFLLKRDLNPAANDNSPMWLEKAA